MWDLSSPPGIEPVPLALEGEVLTTGPPGKSQHKCGFLKKFIYFIYFWLRWVFVAVHGLSLVAVSGGYSSLPCTGFSLQWPLLLRNTGSRRVGSSSCGVRAQ